jgi:hypothetical protein
MEIRIARYTSQKKKRRNGLITKKPFVVYYMNYASSLVIRKIRY